MSIRIITDSASDLSEKKNSHLTVLPMILSI